MTDRPKPNPPDQPMHAAPRPRAERLLWLLLALVLVLGAGVVVSFGIASHADSKSDRAGRDARDAKSQARTLYSQAASAGATPSVTPSGVAPASVIAGPAGARGATGPGASDEQVATAVQARINAAVTTVCTTTTLCQAPIKMAALVSAVTAACDGTCKGTKGDTGTGAPGPSGAAGASGASGASAPPLTADQVATALALNCGGSCVGPKGDKGDTGPAGVSIVSIDCTGLGIDRLVIHLSDGSTQDVPCAAATPTPTDTPSGEPS